MKARNHYEELALSSACEAVLEIGNAGNSYMDERAPWSLFKQGGASSDAAAKVIQFRNPSLFMNLISDTKFQSTLLPNIQELIL